MELADTNSMMEELVRLARATINGNYILNSRDDGNGEKRWKE
jgi:flagellin-like hook-associated protein FlgL